MGEIRALLRLDLNGFLTNLYNNHLSARLGLDAYPGGLPGRSPVADEMAAEVVNTDW